MQKALTLLRTNFIILIRQRALLISSLGLAVISMLIFGFLFSNNTSTKTVVGEVDQDHSSISVQTVNQLQKSDALRIYTGGSNSEQQAVVLLTLAIWIFNVHIYGNIGLLILVVIMGSLTLLAIGFAIASFVKKYPDFLQPLIHAMPLYYLNEALRQVINNGAGWSAIQTGMLVMAAWIVASLLVVWRGFRWL